MKISIIGVGLIGGSMALKLREKGIASFIYGIDYNKHCLLYTSPSPRDRG